MDVLAAPPVVRPGAPPELAGRSALLASVESRIGRNGSVVLTGPSGIGKTALLEAVGAAAAGRGELVLRVAGTETERWVPCSGLAELLDQLPGALTAELPRERLSGLPEPHPAASSDHVACRLAFRGLLARCAEERPVLLLVDDAQWLDAESVHAVRYTVGRLGPRGVRAVVAGRWPDGFAAGDTWTPAPDAAHLPVPPLEPDELAEMFDGYGLPVRVVNTLHADSGGNPYLALALGGAFTGRVPRHWRPAPLPQRVRAVIAERLARLPEGTRETLLTAALAIRPTADLLRRAGRAEAARDIGHAAGLGLLIAEGGGIRFTPPAVGTVLAESADAPHLARVHRALAEAVPDAAGRARHRALADPGPNAELAHSLVTAAEQAVRQGSHRMAAELYLLAADRSPAEPAAERTEWLVAAAETGASGGLPDLAHRAADAVLAADATRAQRVRVRLALLDLSGQGLTEMGELFAAALVDAEGDPALLGQVRLRMALGTLVTGAPGRAEQEVDAALVHACDTGDTDLEARALAVRANIALIEGRGDYAGDLERARRLPEPALDGRLHMTPRYLAAYCAIFEDRLTEARAELLRLLALVERGSGEEVVHVLRNLSEVSARTGRCREALDFADRAMRVTEQAALSPGPAWYHGALAELAGGGIDRAVALAERGVRASEQENDVIFQSRLLHVLGVAQMRSGDVRTGVDTLRRIEALGQDRWLPSPMVLPWQCDLAEGLAVLGDTGRAAELIRTTRAAVGYRGAGVTGRLDRAEAAVLAARGEPDAAVALLSEAAALFARLGQPLEAGRCLLDQARVERRRRRGAPARRAAEDALEIFSRCEARPWIEQARHRLSRLETGLRDGPAAPGSVARASLTEGERRIAVLVGQGATNQQVANRLYLSVKTVEASLTRVYRKLGIRSRAQLGSLLGGGPAGPGASPPH
ncbi:AAA family ATPase [Actinomadura luteofluorescens]|uniref:DNA-binding CsgD family transcriptional regulator/tetratricopeptide (TPR) repeat protein/energy-coupling factor transporter ATP-binding protein EcfA2 n=1 Tax=Actinomadura luteofluorescens TaxID=46163 RepID=A0A7Y9JFL8_9ACTN|nr:LuxR family transcriptional regulator [Actinomadura luteofluorescens]NYD47332.1 DNA-binding CsgD family transcriptional regulator/tetratricopeptide (TPR) repeat protein/energy-coupling factor transporter ATP-binding protein EcfA2 [Actinomadura luteofluorescens]